MRLAPRYAALAFLAGLMVACSSGGTPRSVAARGNSNLLTREVIESSTRANAHEIIRALRPSWLIKKGSHSITSGQGEIVVYYGASRLGGPETLKEIATHDIESLQFISASAATQRYGTNHDHGVILVTPRVSSP